MRNSTLDQLIDDREHKRPVILATNLKSGSQTLLYPDALEDDDPVHDAARRVFGSDQSAMVQTDAGEVFLHVQNPPLRMIIIGAVHIAQALVPVAQQAGYAITVIDPRGAFATPERFPGIDLRAEWPDEIWGDLSVDRRTAIVALTHDPKIDDPALSRAVRSEAYYIGALGSRKTNAARRERLQTAGLEESAIGRIHAPIGLDIGARGPVEIAISIIAEVTMALRKPEMRAA